MSIPKYFNVYNIILWLIKSKHFYISRKHTPHKSPSFIFSHKSSTTHCKHVTVECFFKNADWYRVIFAWASKYSMNCWWACFLKIFSTCDNTDIGRYFAPTFNETLPLWMGVNRASFQSDGITRDITERLNKCVRELVLIILSPTVGRHCYCLHSVFGRLVTTLPSSIVTNSKEEIVAGFSI